MELQIRVEKYWTNSAQRYSESIQNELKGFNLQVLSPSSL